MILKWPHRKPAEAKSAGLGVVLQNFRDHISVGTAVYSLHGVLPAWCTAWMVYCLHGVQPARGTAYTMYNLHGVLPVQLCIMPCVHLGGLGISRSVSKDPRLKLQEGA